MTRYAQKKKEKYIVYKLDAAQLARLNAFTFIQRRRRWRRHRRRRRQVKRKEAWRDTLSLFLFLSFNRRPTIANTSDPNVS